MSKIKDQGHDAMMSLNWLKYLDLICRPTQKHRYPRSTLLVFTGIIHL